MATLTECRQDDIAVLRLIGGLTYEGVVPVAKRFEAQTCNGHVIVDLAEVPIVTTPGLSLLLGAQQRLTHAGGKMVLVGLSANIADMLRRCRLDRIFTLLPDATAAVTLLRNSDQSVSA